MTRGNIAKTLLLFSVPLILGNLLQILYLIFDYPHEHYTFKHFEV